MAVVPKGRCTTWWQRLAFGLVVFMASILVVALKTCEFFLTRRLFRAIMKFRVNIHENTYNDIVSHVKFRAECG